MKATENTTVMAGRDDPVPLEGKHDHTEHTRKGVKAAT